MSDEKPANKIKPDKPDHYLISGVRIPIINSDEWHAGRQQARHVCGAAGPLNGPCAACDKLQFRGGSTR